jgi:hypothetical protein
MREFQNNVQNKWLPLSDFPAGKSALLSSSMIRTDGADLSPRVIPLLLHAAKNASPKDRIAYRYCPLRLGVWMLAVWLLCAFIF